MIREARLTLISKAGCHLCDDALALVNAVLAELAQSHPALRTTLELVDLFSSEELTARYAEEIPVLLIDGRVHGYWRLDSERLRSALLAVANAEPK